jgi:3-phenylpropionate/trans-cinnamate dioxygenase ferredoxin subunit
LAKHEVAKLSDLGIGELLLVEAGGHPICLGRVQDGTVYAVSDTCTHEEASLSEGEIWERSVQCPQHGSLFDLATGEVTGLPAQIPIRTFPVVVEHDSIYLETD